MSFKLRQMKDPSIRSYTMPVLEYRPLKEEAEPLQRVDPDAVEREAYEKGYAAGERAGMEMAEKKGAVLLENLEQLFREVYAFKEKLLAEIEPQIILLTVTLARQVIHDELSARPEIIEEMIRAGLKKLHGPGPLTVRVRPHLFEFLGKKRAVFEAEFPGLTFESDPQAPAGGAIIRSPSQEVQTDLDFQLSHLVEALRNPV